MSVGCCDWLSGRCYADVMVFQFFLSLVNMLQWVCWHVSGCQGVALQLLRCSDFWFLLACCSVVVGVL